MFLKSTVCLDLGYRTRLHSCLIEHMVYECPHACMDAHEATFEKLKEGGPMCIFALETPVVDAGLLSRVTRSLGNC